MSDRTLAIIFRNPHPQRSPLRVKLYLLRPDGSSMHSDYPDEGHLRNVRQPSSQSDTAEL
jgi:hypothetical protein